MSSIYTHLESFVHVASHYSGSKDADDRIDFLSIFQQFLIPKTLRTEKEN